MRGFKKSQWDGWRLLARKEGDPVRLWTRGNFEWSKQLPMLAQAVAHVPTETAWLDGELVHLGDDGRPDFKAVMFDVRARR